MIWPLPVGIVTITVPSLPVVPPTCPSGLPLLSVTVTVTFTPLAPEPHDVALIVTLTGVPMATFEGPDVNASVGLAGIVVVGVESSANVSPEKDDPVNA